MPLCQEVWILVGNGHRLFEDANPPVPFQLVDSKRFSTGVMSLRYAPAY